VNRVHKMVNRVAHQSTVDSRRWRLERLIGAWLTGAAEPTSSPSVGEKKMGAPGDPHLGLQWPVRWRGEIGDGEGRTTAVKLGVRRVWA
jgi:hypothetical protein